MNFTNTWGLLLVEGSIVVSVLITILFIRRALEPIPPKRIKALSSGKKNLEINLEKINQSLKECQTLSQDFSSDLAEKKEIVKILVELVDKKIQSLSQLLERVEGQIPASPPGPGSKDGNGQILEMAMGGCSVADIAKRLGLSKEEVQLILDVKKIAIN